MNLDSIETTTFHDQAPSHPAVPDAVLAARRERDRAYRLHDQAVDLWYDGVLGRASVDVLATAAIIAEKRYWQAWDRANAGCPEGNGLA